MSDEDKFDRYLAPGTKVSLSNPTDGQDEHGVVIHCWCDEDIKAYAAPIMWIFPMVLEHRFGLNDS